MPTTRGWATLVGGFGLWIGSRFVGSPDLHMVALGIMVLPVVATLFVRWSHVRLDIHRSLSHPRVYPQTRVQVTLRLENLGRATVPFLLLEDTVPAALGRPARLVVTGVPSKNAATVSYSIVCRHRGRFVLGPVTVYTTDPFGMARSPIRSSATNELVVYPEVEDLEPWKMGMQGAGSGESAARHLHQSAAEFYTMREYVTGDDLRRIHWASVAHTGRLMIRQDEATRRSVAALLLDNRASALGADGSPGFERAVSAAASIGRMLMRGGFTVQLATAEGPSQAVGEERFLETLSSIGAVRAKALGDALIRLRATSRADTALVLVGAVPLKGEVAAMLRVGSVFGRKLAVFVYPVSTSRLPPEAVSEIEQRASSARLSLLRAGWEVYFVQPDGRLQDVWQPARNSRALHRVAPSF